MENIFGSVCRCSLQPTKDAGHVRFGFPDHVHMIGHNDKGMEHIKAALGLAIAQRFNHHAGHLWMTEPLPPGSSAVQQPVSCQKALAGGGVREQQGRRRPGQ